MQYANSDVFIVTSLIVVEKGNGPVEFGCSERI